jgi:thioredoxin reductase/Pyruvate/2-oxoacid:ferredoxin oxidoreductase delta subunit
MEQLFTWGIAALVLGFFVLRYWIAHRRTEARAREAAERGPLFSEGPRAQHPKIHADSCIGCGACVTACPEGDVLAVVNGKATIVNGHKCIGHSLCADECPVGAIEMVMAKPSSTSDMPRLSEQNETSVEGLFIAGELGGLALIKNAVNQGRDCVDIVAERLSSQPPVSAGGEVFDLVVVGAGPAGISASLRAAEHKLSTLTLEREEIGGTVSKYPRQKLVLTSPVEFPLHGKFRKMQLSKEELIQFWESVMKRTDLNIHTGEVVDSLCKCDDGLFHIRTAKGEYRSRAAILALGRSGTPRKLGVPGEELPHVLYRLIEADHYTNKNILVVGGGDSAVEAAMGLAHQPGNRVTISYRRGDFVRLKDRNAKRIEDHIRTRKIEVLFNSEPTEFRAGSVLIKTSDGERELPNDCTWIFAGGIPPSDFLKAAGVAFGESTNNNAPVQQAVAAH